MLSQRINTSWLVQALDRELVILLLAAGIEDDPAEAAALVELVTLGVDHGRPPLGVVGIAHEAPDDLHGSLDQDLLAALPARHRALDFDRAEPEPAAVR